ncbi:MAG TPA: precorrin-6y C5,15-methyltransferase (decarboxylating) subunit CbiE [Magnetospirillaceae bacterium]|jgi:precorrin-6Y C5,15-methyltransferase (decarboxylating)
MKRDAMKPWLSVIGIGEDGFMGLTASARALIHAAQVVIGGARHLEMIPPSRARRIVWGALQADLAAIEEMRGERVCVLASGDPMWFGIGATLAKRFPREEMTIISHPGAFSLAAAKLGWPLAEVACLSVHGRPLETVPLHLHPGARLLILAEDAATPTKLAALLRDQGFGKSRITVLERLGGAGEKITSNTAAKWRAGKIDPLTTFAVEVIADSASAVRSRVAGLSEDLFIHDGQITQHEVRAAALAALAPWPGALLWDIGAGAGSVAIEWMRAGGHAIAIEREAKRRDFIARNAIHLGVPQIEIIAGTAPVALKGLAAPDAIFVGGGTSDARILETAWRALRTGGRLVAHAVTIEGEAALTLFHVKHGGALTRLSIARLAGVGRFHRWHPQAPVTQYAVVKS